MDMWSDLDPVKAIIKADVFSLCGCGAETGDAAAKGLATVHPPPLFRQVSPVRSRTLAIGTFPPTRTSDKRPVHHSKLILPSSSSLRLSAASPCMIP